MESSDDEYLLMKSIPPVYLNTPKSFRAVGLVQTEKKAKNRREALAPSDRLHLFDTSVQLQRRKKYGTLQDVSELMRSR